MDLKFEVSARIAKPVEEVFEAVANPDVLSEYFTTGGAEGRLETGATVIWKFGEFPEGFPVEVVQVDQNKLIILRWDSDDKDTPAPRTEVTMRFEAMDDGRTLMTITEEGWRETPTGLKASYGNCMGWSHMQCALKGWLEHGINLREGMYE